MRMVQNNKKLNNKIKSSFISQMPLIMNKETLDQRKREEEYVRSIDDTKVDSSKKVWYLINAKWLKEWRDYVSIAEAPRPGKINNDELFGKSNLKKVKDYRGLCENVWNYFVEKYGSDGTVFTSKGEIDIYQNYHKIVEKYTGNEELEKLLHSETEMGSEYKLPDECDD